MKRKLFFTLIALLAAITSAQAKEYIDGLYYNLDATTQTAEITYASIVSGSSNSSYVIGELTIPETITYNGLAYSVTSIGKSAFYCCYSLTSVTIPNSVTSIGDNAFGGVPNIVYSGSATGAPWGAKSMNGYVDGYLVYSDNTKTTLLACSAVAIGEITIPNSVTSIGRNAFYYCSGLTSVTIPNSVTSIENYAFGFCKSLTSVTIPESVTSIGGFAFYNCTNLASIVLPYGITIIYTYTFRNCSSLTSIKIPTTVTEIESEAFEDCTSLKEVVFPSSVKKIGNYAFRSCSDLEILTVGSGLTSAETKIGGSVFDKCNKLKEVYFVSESPSSQSLVYKVDYKRTFKVNDFTKFYIPCGASNAYSLTLGFGGDEYSGKGRVVVESSDTIMGNVSIIHQANCKDIAIVEAVPTDGNYFLCWSDGVTDSYYSVTITKDTLLKAEFYAIGTGSGRCGDDLYWTLADGNLFISGSGAMYDYTEETQPWYKMKDYIRSVSFPADMTTVGDYAFYGCKNLTSVTIPQNVTVIGDYSFAECTALERVVIGSGVTSIRCGAFYNDWRIEEITCYPVLVPEVCENSFYNVSNLTYLYVQSDRMRQYQLNPYLKDFDIRPIGATEVNSSTGVTVVPSDRDAQFTWPANGNASSYTLQITKNGEVFCTLVFNEYGQLTGIAFAPARNGEQHPRQAATATTNGWQFTVTGLNEGSAYAYTLDVKDAANNVLNSYNGTFRTEGGNDDNDDDNKGNGGNGGEEPALWILSVYSDNPEWGNVTGAGTYEDGTEATIEAIPASGYRFLYWNDNKTTNPRTVLMTEDAVYTAYFDRITQGTDDLSSDTFAHPCKVIENGNVYILLPDGRKLNMQGAEVK